MDVLSLILLVLGIVLALLAFLNAFAKASKVVGVVGVALLIFGILGAIGTIDFSGVGGGQSFTSAPQQQFGAPLPQTGGCLPQAFTSNGLSQADVLYRNAENTTGIGYLAASISANAGGSFIASTTTNAGGSGTSYVSMSTIPNCGAGELIATVTTGTGAAASRKVTDVEKRIAVAGYDFTDKAAHKYEIVGASSDVVNIQARDNALAAASSANSSGSSATPDMAISGTGTADGTAYFDNTSLGSKGSINFYIDIKVNGTASVFGAYEEPDGVIISYDTETASVFTSNSLDLQSDVSGWSLTKLGSCPADIVSNRNVEACWSAPSMKAGKLYRVKGTLVADGGDATVESNPAIWIDDKVFFRDIDGQIKYQSFSSSGGTNQGVGGTSLQFVLS